MKYVMFKGLFDGVFYRGAISVGKCLILENQYLGSAIIDAAEWYDKSNWFGIILTPNCEFHTIYRIIEEQKVNPAFEKLIIDSYIIKYRVPIEDGYKKLFTVTWPFEYLLEINNKEKKGKITPLGLYACDISKSRIPYGIEDKYYNCLDYFKWYSSEIFPKIKEKSIELYGQGNSSN